MNIDTKQKVMIGFILIALAILVWQVMLLLKNNTNDSNQSTPPPTAVATTNTSSAINKSQPFPAAAAAVTNADNQVANSLSATASAQPTNAPNIPQPSNSVQTSNVSGANVDPAVAANQQQYLQLVTEYQMVQIQRMIAEDEEAIAIAKSNAAKAVASTVQLAGGTPSTVSSVIPATADSNDYELIFTGQQGDQWTATVKKDGQLYDIVVGTKLPDDSQVMAIDDNGVLLSQGDAKKLITFSGVSLIGAQAATNNAHNDLSGVTASNEINNNTNNANDYADNNTASAQPGLVQNSNAPKLADQNADETNGVVTNSNGNNNLANNNTRNVYAQNAVTASQENNVSNINPLTDNGQSSVVPVEHSSAKSSNVLAGNAITPSNDAVIKKTAISSVVYNSTNGAVIDAPVNSAANMSVTAPVIKKVSTNIVVNDSANSVVNKPVNSAANIAVTPAVIKKMSANIVVNNSTNNAVIKEPNNSGATISVAAPIINKAPNNSVVNHSVTASLIKKAPTNNVANIPAVVVPGVDKAPSSTLAVNTLSIASNKQLVKPNVTTVLPLITAQAKSFDSAVEEFPAQIAKANSTDYTIQLIADDHMGPLTNYLKENSLQNKAVPLLTHRWGKDWYILVYGQYKSAAEANAAIRQLPKLAVQWGPFVRRIGDVQIMVNNAIANHQITGTALE